MSFLIKMTLGLARATVMNAVRKSIAASFSTVSFQNYTYYKLIWYIGTKTARNIIAY